MKDQYLKHLIQIGDVFHFLEYSENQTFFSCIVCECNHIEMDEIDPFIKLFGYWSNDNLSILLIFFFLNYQDLTFTGKKVLSSIMTNLSDQQVNEIKSIDSARLIRVIIMVIIMDQMII